MASHPTTHAKETRPADGSVWENRKTKKRVIITETTDTCAFYSYTSGKKNTADHLDDFLVKFALVAK